MTEVGVSSRSPLDVAFDVLANRYRRRLLVALLDHDTLVPDEVTGEARRLEVVHTHLPKLEDAGFVEWDRKTDTVRRGPRYDDVRPLLELVDDHADELPGGWP